MEKSTLPVILQMMDTVPFFENVTSSHPALESDGTFCNSLESFEHRIRSEEWESVRSEAAAQLSLTLNRKFQNQYQEWNSVAKAARLFFDERIATKLRQFEQAHGLKSLADDIGYDISHIIIEEYFVKRVGIKRMLFSRLLDVYKQGRIPCGYTVFPEKNHAQPVGKIISFSPPSIM
ncbi:hypothetical protein [Chromobacterium aquaticum]|uniref:HTH araC/xylS-type domain-containing protein n=1 Tax=Chromobacterium aquaticum TaxID=467180 RepID=A0ABV9A074_9NEIS|nr:hypothetical protein [Chromobacterium aquaticum]MCD5361844.1 hypothetical protein [Chromobacterium aquaticum]